MPHIVIEYSSNVEPSVDMGAVVNAAHKSLGENLGDAASRIKTRAVPMPHYAVGDDGADGHMVHITLLLLEGRDDDTKNKYGGDIHKAVGDIVQVKLPDCKITLEVRDMTKAHYIL